jgi:hypothetical protein
VWRTCRVCDWEGRVVETEHTAGVDAICPRCHALTELVAMAPVPERGVPREKEMDGATSTSLKRRGLAHRKRARRPKQRKG